MQDPAFAARPFLRNLQLKPVQRLFKEARIGVLAFLALTPAYLSVSCQLAAPIGMQGKAGQVQTLANHHPLWASLANDIGPVPYAQPLDNMTLVLARSPRQEKAFEQFLADQQNPASPEYHHWLTPAQIGDRFGLADADIATVTAWLHSERLHVNWVAPSRVFIGFGGTAGDINRAFGTELRAYRVNGAKRMSVSSDPSVPAAISPIIKAIRGLYTIDERPTYHSALRRLASPELTASSGSHFIVPGDFNKIYDAATESGGRGQAIGIVSCSRTNFADFDNFRRKTGMAFSNPTEVIPTKYGGIDPGPALMTEQPSGTDLSAQAEATLDVTRAGSVAPLAKILLVASAPSSPSSLNGDGIGADAQYLVQTNPVPVQVMNISFGACESSAGQAGVAYWDALFQQAAAEGISVTVSSGDSGAAGCDTAFTTPPVTPGTNSPNYICSSAYATCVGGTEFNDTADPSAYWDSNNNQGDLSSATGYIPEGGWNESWDGTKSSVAASGGGVSQIIPTPSWQIGVAGVPAGNTGRYTPDVSFSASCHDAYFGCFAAGGGSCVDDSTGHFYFSSFCGTSAGAPSMAGVIAMLDDSLGAPQGNINPEIYNLAAAGAPVFHDVTLTSSGVSSCDINTASMCNNSIPGPKGLSGGQPGYAVGIGFDEVTGLGSLDVWSFTRYFMTGPTIKMLTYPPSLTFGTRIVGISGTEQIQVYNSGSPALNPLSMTFSGSNPGDFSQTNDCPTPLNWGSTCTIQVSFTPTAVGPRSATMAIASSNATNSPQTVALSGTGTDQLITPSVSAWAPNDVTTADDVAVSVLVIDTDGQYGYPTGTAVLFSGSYLSAPATLTNGEGSFTIPHGTLPIGADVLNVAYTPDAAGARIFKSATGTTSLVVSAPKITPTVTVTPSLTTVDCSKGFSVTVSVSGPSGQPIPTGTVYLSGGYYFSSVTAISKGSVTFNVDAGTIGAPGTYIFTANYFGDSIYNAATGTGTVTITGSPGFLISALPVLVKRSYSTTGTSGVTVRPYGSFTGKVALAASVTESPAGAVYPPTVSFGANSTVNIFEGTTPETATLTISTTATNTGAVVYPTRPGGAWPAAGEIALVGICLICWPVRRPSGLTKFSLVVLLGVLVSVAASCGGGGQGSGGGGGGISGTTPGNYTITITGTSGSTTSTSTVSVTVQ